ncbi:MAG: acetylglutamate kinase [Acidobacteria bacterium]|nr:acetylglutamate kinase [Acidobacteriota bacterium]
MKILIKLGGTLLDTPEIRAAMAAQIAEAFRNYPRTTVVHGGGKQMTRFLAERNVESRFVDGLRVTTSEVLDAVLKVFAGSVNHQLVASLVAAGVPAVGLTGVDAYLCEAEPLRDDLGHVGKPVRSNPAVLDTLNGGGFLPVVACVGGDRNGRIYNVNADQMAVSCAAGFGASKLLFLTDVDGVKGAGGEVIATLTVAEAQKLISDGVATGGMQAKLDAAAGALKAGVGEVIIAPGAAPGIVARLLRTEPVGTRFVSG